MRTLPSFLCRTAAGFAAALFLMPVVRAANEPAAVPSGETHVLFMGADLSVQRDGKLYKVEDVNGSELKIHVGKEEVSVPTRKGPLGFQIHPGLKLAEASVRLDELKSGAAYTPANDPARKLKQAASNAMDLASLQDMAEANLMRSLNNQSQLQRSVDAGGNGTASNQAELSKAQDTVRQNEQQMAMIDAAARGDFGNVGAGAHQMQIAEGNYDAMEVAFKVSSPIELENPYMVILFRFHDRAAKPGVDGLLIHVQALDPIEANATPRYVRVLKGGLPVGFKFVDCTVHLYNRGREVATNVSANRVEMTRNETQQYLVMEYVGSHKGADASAAPVRGTLPRALQRSLALDQLRRQLWVKVSADGTPQAAFADEACNLRVEDAGTSDALNHAFFVPALRAGKPVEGVARVRLGEI